jgi:hypothetical protein
LARRADGQRARQGRGDGCYAVTAVMVVRLIGCPWPRGCFATDVNCDGYASIGGERCACAARRGAGRTYYLPPGPGRIASPVCPDLIYERDNVLARLLGVGDVQIIGGRRRGGDDPVSTTRTKPHRPKERNDDRPQDRNACYTSLEGRASPILICWARNSRKARIRIGRSPPCPR